MRHFMVAVLFCGLLGWPAVRAMAQRTVMDDGRKFVYSDSAGVTASYLAYFGDTLAVPVLERMDGQMLRPEDIRGKTVVFNFWFTACKPCVAEIPVLNRLAQKYRSDSVVFIGVTWDEKEKIDAFLASRAFDFLIVRSSMEEIQRFKKVSLYPLTAIVNKRGRISFVIFARQASEGDEAFYEVLERQVGKVLAE